MTTINSGGNLFAVNFSSARDHAARKDFIHRKNAASNTNSNRAFSVKSTISVTGKTVATEVYYEIRNINSAISALQYLLTLRKSLTKTLTKMKALKLQSKSNLILNNDTEMFQKELQVLHRGWEKLGNTKQQYLPSVIKFDQRGAEILQDIYKNRIRTVIGEFFQKRQKEPFAASNAKPAPNYLYEPQNDQLSENSLLMKEGSKGIEKIDSAIHSLSEENTLIKKAISQLQIASDKAIDKTINRKTLHSRIKDYFSALKITHITKQLMVENNNLEFFSPFNRPLAQGLVLLD